MHNRFDLPGSLRHVQWACNFVPLALQLMSHYDKRYFDWHQNIGAFGGLVNTWMFAPFLQPTDRVLDFGCGGGYLLANLPAAERHGLEVNPVALETARHNGLTMYQRLQDVPDNYFDVVMSNSALEHTPHPLQEMEQLYRKVRPGGQIVFQVPHEVRAPYRTGDINQHLYTWSEMNFGNLARTAGFQIQRIRTHSWAWPPKHTLFYRLLGRGGFTWFCRYLYGPLLHPLYTRLNWKHYGLIRYVHLVATKPE